MPERFSTKELAEEVACQKLLTLAEDEEKTNFCPLIRKGCNIKCRAYSRPEVRGKGFKDGKATHWEIIEGHCTSPLINGLINAYVQMN